MFKYTKHSLKKIETVLEELGYTIRYEKGNFQSGYCIVESRDIAVVNKFFDTEARINCLLDIIGTIEVEDGRLTEKSAQFFQMLHKKVINREEETAEGEEAVVEKEETEKTN